MFGSLGKFNAQNSQWDPRQSADWDKTEPSAMCKKRMQHDLANSLSDEDCMGIYIQPDEKNITKLYALLIGPKDTPYEGVSCILQYYVDICYSLRALVRRDIFCSMCAVHQIIH